LRRAGLFKVIMLAIQKDKILCGHRIIFGIMARSVVSNLDFFPYPQITAHHLTGLYILAKSQRDFVP
jgi:hypothetical protein